MWLTDLLRTRVARVTATAAVVAFGACGTEGNVGKRWAQAVDDEQWAAACELMVPRGDCRQRLEREYAGRDVRLLEAGGYQEGPRVTDNETRFAIRAEMGGKGSTTYYEVERRGGRDLVDLKVTVLDF